MYIHKRYNLAQIKRSLGADAPLLPRTFWQQKKVEQENKNNNLMSEIVEKEKSWVEVEMVNNRNLTPVERHSYGCHDNGGKRRSNVMLWRQKNSSDVTARDESYYSSRNVVRLLEHTGTTRLRNIRSFSPAGVKSGRKKTSKIQHVAQNFLWKVT